MRGPQSDAIDQLDALKDLFRRDWDSYDAEPISPVALDYAKIFVQSIRSAVGRSTPIAGPTPDGGVSLVWRGKGKLKVEVFFAPLQPRSPTFVISESGHLKSKGKIEDVGTFARTVIKPLTPG